MAETGYPEITEDQREMVVTMLANAVRKDAHLRARVAESPAEPLRAALVQRRAEPSQRYIEGMRDLLRVLFVNGATIADECLEAAYARALGVVAPRDGSGSVA